MRINMRMIRILSESFGSIEAVCYCELCVISTTLFLYLFVVEYNILIAKDELVFNNL